jgi:hypothetical protein
MDNETGYIDSPRCDCGNGVAADGDWCDECRAEDAREAEIEAREAAAPCPCCGCVGGCGYDFDAMGED